MNGETGWTVDTLREHFQRQLDDLRAMLDERYATQVKAVDAAFAAQQIAMTTALAAAERAVQTAMVASEKAGDKAERASNDRFASVNEFRQTLTDQATSFMTRVEYNSQRDASAERIRELAARMDRSEGRTSGVSAGWGVLVGAVGLVAAVVAVIVGLR